MLAFQAVDYRLIGRFAWGVLRRQPALILYTVLPGVPQSGLVRRAGRSRGSATGSTSARSASSRRS